MLSDSIVKYQNPLEMARNRHPLIRLQGTIAGLTFVDSKAYKPHVRLKRGSHKKAQCNTVLQANINKANPVTAFGSPLYALLKQNWGDFINPQLWQQMMHCFFTCPGISASELAKSLTGLELNINYPLQKILYRLPSIQIIITGNKCWIDANFLSHPLFERKVAADSYYYELTVVWMDKKAKRLEMESIETEWVRNTETIPCYEMEFTKPSWAEVYLLILQVQAGKGQEKVISATGRGMLVLQGGETRRYLP